MSRLCRKCNKQIPDRVFLADGLIKKSSLGRKYCYNCIPFGKRKLNKQDGLKCYCQRCNRDYIYYRKQGCSTKQCMSCTTYIARIKKKQKAVNYMGGKCQICGYNKCNQALQFHHKNPDEKKFNISSNYCVKWDTWKEELDKCIMVCANCHAEIENGLVKY